MVIRQLAKVIGLVWVLIACKQEIGYNPQPPLQYGAYYWGEVVGTRNKVPMLNPRILSTLTGDYPPMPCDQEHFTVRIDEFDGSGCLRLILGLKSIPRGVKELGQFQTKLLPERCQPQDLPHVALFLMKCDIYLGSYLIDSLKQSKLSINTFDTTTREVRGSFRLHLRLNERPPATALNAPDTLFYEATFKTKLLPEAQSRYQ